MLKIRHVSPRSAWIEPRSGPQKPEYCERSTGEWIMQALHGRIEIPDRVQIPSSRGLKCNLDPAPTTSILDDNATFVRKRKNAKHFKYWLNIKSSKPRILYDQQQQKTLLSKDSESLLFAIEFQWHGNANVSFRADITRVANWNTCRICVDKH